jgi:hypothetical protein
MKSNIFLCYVLVFCVGFGCKKKDNEINPTTPTVSTAKIVSNIDTSIYLTCEFAGEPIKFTFPHITHQVFNIIAFASDTTCANGHNKYTVGFVYYDNVAGVTLPYTFQSGNLQWDDCCHINTFLEPTDSLSFLGPFKSNSTVILTDTTNGIWSGTFNGSAISGSGKMKSFSNGYFKINTR